MPKKSTPTINKSNNVFIISTGKDFSFVDFGNIVYLEAENNYTSVYLYDNTRYMLCRTLKVLENTLPAEHFFRCHKSFLVNLSYIGKIKLNGAGSITLTTGKSIPVARRKTATMRKRLKLYYK